MESKLLELLDHWKETHEHLNADELNENYRCMADVIDLLEGTKAFGLKKAMKLSLKEWRQYILKLNCCQLPDKNTLT